MKIALILVTCSLLIASAVAQEKSTVKPANPALEAKVQKLWQAFKNKDKVALAATLSEGFREMEEGGSGLGDKKAEIAMVDDFELTSYTLKEFTVKSLGPQSALVTYSAQYEGKSGGEVSKSNSIFGEVWVHEGSDWKALYIQEIVVK